MDNYRPAYEKKKRAPTDSKGSLYVKTMPSHLPKPSANKRIGFEGISTMTFGPMTTRLNTSAITGESVAGLHRAFPSASLDKKNMKF
jgi:hypothetical protein